MKTNAHTYYNKSQQHDMKQRNDSEIFYMCNFNNWIKSTLKSVRKISSINYFVNTYITDEYLQRIREE
jgi:hypothetical protein